MPGSGPTRKTSESTGGDMSEQRPLAPNCPCGSGNTLDQCCGRYHADTPAPSAELLMCSRYSAYVLGVVDYLQDTTLPVKLKPLDMSGHASRTLDRIRMARG